MDLSIGLDNPDKTNNTENKNKNKNEMFKEQHCNSFCNYNNQENRTECKNRCLCPTEKINDINSLISPICSSNNNFYANHKPMHYESIPKDKKKNEK